MSKSYAWVIDDDSIYTFTIKKLIEKNNLADKIDVFKNGRDALDALNDKALSDRGYPDIILLDINMPVIDGWQFMEEFVNFSDKSSIVLYMVSSSIDARDVIKSKSFKEIKDFIVKPVTLQSLKLLMAS